MTKKELTFKEGYEVLKKNAELLESQEEPEHRFSQENLCSGI